jgi:hypothetical protein
MGRTGNRHLHYLVESISVNVGGSRQNGKVSSLPRSVESVGGVIVLGAQENCVQGEGRQEFNVPLYSLTASPVKSGRRGCLSGGEREREDKAESNLGGGKLNSGEPDTLKGVSPVRRRGCRDVPGLKYTERPHGDSIPISTISEVTRYVPILPWQAPTADPD